MKKRVWFGLFVILAVELLCHKDSPPESPLPPRGVSIGGPNIPYQFTATAFDPEGDSIAIRFCWGDGDTSEWSQFVPSGESIRMSHSCTATGNYLVRAQAKDKSARLTAWSNPLYLTIGEGILKWRFPKEGVFMCLSVQR